nr:hypothetical protein [Specibacter cremeus]
MRCVGITSNRGSPSSPASRSSTIRVASAHAVGIVGHQRGAEDVGQVEVVEADQRLQGPDRDAVVRRDQGRRRQRTGHQVQHRIPRGGGVVRVGPHEPLPISDPGILQRSREPRRAFHLRGEPAQVPDQADAGPGVSHTGE